jgi:hypothetical protein
MMAHTRASQARPELVQQPSALLMGLDEAEAEEEEEALEKVIRKVDEKAPDCFQVSPITRQPANDTTQPHNSPNYPY